MKHPSRLLKTIALPVLLNALPACSAGYYFDKLRTRLQQSLSAPQAGLQPDGSYVNCVGNRNIEHARALAVTQARSRLHYITRCAPEKIQVEVAEEEDGNIVCAKAVCTE